MNSVLMFSGGVKSACSKSFKFFIKNILKIKKLFTAYFSLFTKKNFAFTLAETLIVMGTIGIVAALTLPNLNSSTGNKEKVAKVKKIYQNLTDAFGRAEAVYGPIEEWCTDYFSDSCISKTFGRITEFLKVSKVCNESTGCSSLFKYVPGGWAKSDVAVLSDGTAVTTYSGTYNSTGTTQYKIVFIVDIDGLNKGTNEGGKDIFSFEYDTINRQQGLTPDGLSYYQTIGKSCSVGSCTTYLYGMGAATCWIILFDNTDYLKTKDGTTCPDGVTKLTFNGNHSCN